MNATIEFSDDSNADWTPSLEDCEKWINKAIKVFARDCSYSISLRFVDPQDSSELNNSYRSKDSATNVLSFPANFPEELVSSLEYRPLGDIVVCPQIVSREAQEQGKELEAHWAHMLVHGVLHLGGFDHSDETEAKLMEFHEVNTLEKLGFPNPYLIG